ncbi:Hypothetical Protein RradSPS_2198 [Rubrobacter radiotolerans]|uniref:Ribbon-helix-helix protein, copG family n=1 Tax=Rubrobacter radiotolerans TaxID=42256 RepID=A0A023X5K1_RUBRA|nr:hypothetical protein [Rubrobacter radiotolerans]AHY47481.1 Hypothetical Protein RradSPS_2198 [Rubrobacter radiotolerans]MDX5894885.1 hypothetical protein [Rubrobacter radiotolerans]SMC06997.1 hypothetical protein SAMN00767673_2200 [Rubrobacter radiotolerans DSM 5868]
MPEDLMESILSEGSGLPGEDHLPADDRTAVPKPSLSGSGPLDWDERPERVGITFNLSKQLGVRLEEVRQKLQPGEQQGQLSRSELAEAALRLAVEDVHRRGRESDLAKRLEEHSATAGETDRKDGTSETVRRSVSRAGLIIETIYDGEGRIVDEDVVGSVSELPVETEYVDEAGRLVSLARDELGNTFEQVFDENLNPLSTRLLPDTEPGLSGDTSEP